MLTESMEDYLEMIYRLGSKNGYVRTVDLAEALRIQASSITKMVQKLDEKGFINYEKYRHIELTQLGKKYGHFLVWRDSTLKLFLELLGAPSGIDEQVEGMEHYITPVTMQLIDHLINFFTENPSTLKSYYLTINPKEISPNFKQLRAWEFRHTI